MSFLIGDTIRLKIQTDPRNWLHLIEVSMAYPPDERNCHYESVPIIGKNISTSDDYIALCNFDPHSYISFKISEWHQAAYDVDKTYLGQRGAFVTDNCHWSIEHKKPVAQLILNEPGGMNCNHCNRFVQYAAINRDNGTFVCKRCRDTKGYLLTCKPL